jgi:DNA-binding CsgD family transcriptional regulator/tetratricopeptide (TPR) repeat protein
METKVTSVLPPGRDWVKEYAELSAIDGDLDPGDLERRAVAAHVLGEDEQAVSLLDRAHRNYLEQGLPDKAARCVFWLIFHLRNAGQNARAAGWIARLRRLLDDDDPDGHLAYLGVLGEGVALMQAGSVIQALPMVERAAAGAQAAGDDDLFVLAGLARGRCLDVQGHRTEALEALDEIMVYVVADRVAPQVVGIAYCSVISLCMDRFDMQRAAEWTQALSRWCDAQSGLMPYRGECQVHRAEILQLHGSWAEATEEVVQVSQRLPAAGFVAGAAHYRLAELYRLRGQFDLAERSYAAAASCGREVQPGLAHLRLAQGNPAAGLAGLDRALAESRSPARRSLLLAAKVEIALAAGTIDAARTALAELEKNAEAIETPYMSALVAHAAGQLRLAEDDPQAALPLLRRAWTLWQQVDAPYEAARTRVKVSAACRALGDDDAARMELDAARTVFEQLGAQSDLASLAPTEGAAPGHPLTARECEVLALVAQGHTNRGIATILFLSEKTVARHLSNIFTKINVNSRAAATAYAYEHQLV